MFINNYINSSNYKLLTETYDKEYLDNLDEENFIKIYNLFKEYKFYFIDDIILKYLEIFELDVEFVKNSIEKLKEELKDNFIFHIGHNLTYLEKIIDPE